MRVSGGLGFVGQDSPCCTNIIFCGMVMHPCCLVQNWFCPQVAVVSQFSLMHACNTLLLHRVCPFSHVGCVCLHPSVVQYVLAGQVAVTIHSPLMHLWRLLLMHRVSPDLHVGCGLVHCAFLHILLDGAHVAIAIHWPPMQPITFVPSHFRAPSWHSFIGRIPGSYGDGFIGFGGYTGLNGFSFWTCPGRIDASPEMVGCR